MTDITDQELEEINRRRRRQGRPPLSRPQAQTARAEVGTGQDWMYYLVAYSVVSGLQREAERPAPETSAPTPAPVYDPPQTHTYDSGGGGDPLGSSVGSDPSGGSYGGDPSGGGSSSGGC